MNLKCKKYSKAIGMYGAKVLFLLCIAFVTFEVWMYRADKKVESLWLYLMVAGALGLLVLAKHLADKLQEFLGQYFMVLLIAYLLALFAIQIICGNHMRYTPMWDLGSVYDGAVSWLENGNVDSYADYFYYFPNNLGLTVVFRCYFGLVHTIFGTQTDYFMAALVLGSLVVTIFRFSVIWICQKLFGMDYAFVMMVLLLLCIPLYFAAAVFYTDVMSMAAPALFYLFYLYAREAASQKKKIVWYVFMALVAAVGMEIKFTVVIILIAVGLELLLHGEWKSFLWLAGVHLLIIGAVFSMVSYVIYSGLLDREQAKIQNTPYLHWVMMGAQGNGSYNGEDYEFTRSYTDREEQSRALKAEIKRRYSELGVQGTLDLWKAKTVKCFGDGTFALSDFLDDEPENYGSWHEWLLYSGQSFGKYQTLCLGVFLAVMLLMLCGVAGSFGKNRMYSFDLTALWLAFFGVWLFLMFWETSARYFTNHLSVMLIAAVYGLPYFEAGVKRAAGAVRGSWQRERERIH